LPWPVSIGDSRALARRVVPVDSAANLGFVDQATVELPAIASATEDERTPRRMVD
jgi:hypothetical protein